MSIEEIAVKLGYGGNSGGLYRATEERMMPVLLDFARYLEMHDEIPRENFAARILEASSSPKIRIILGTQDTEAPRDVTTKFREFVTRQRPLEIEVLRYFTQTERMVTRHGSFYGNPNGYKKVDISS